ncbi:MAG: hypothetical protein QFX34_03670 [Candidatus Verstraetearchaeota archaeon]|nr:hypothetical protein [Candidatus Verstraetearchaeota archaeon]
MDENLLVLSIPSYGITRQYLLSFLNVLDKEKIGIKIDGNKIKVKSAKASLPKVFAEAFYIAEARLRDYVERKTGTEEVDEDSEQKKSVRKPRMDIPATGNEKDILVKVKKDLKVPSDTSFVEVFHHFGDYLVKLENNDLQALAKKEKIHSPLSIFKPELYGYTRGPYFDGKLKSEVISGEEAKLSTWEFLIRLAGYVISRVGIVMIPSGNKPQYLTVLALPTDTRYTRGEFELMLDSMKEFPGFRPEEGMIMWMAMNLPKKVDEILVVGMKNPGGMSPAEVRIGFNVPLASYRAKANKFLDNIEKYDHKRSLQWMIRTAMWEKEADTERELLKLLFLASQGDGRSREELMLRSSRLLLSTSSSSQSASDAKGRDFKRLVDYCRNLAYTVPLLP